MAAHELAHRYLLVAKVAVASSLETEDKGVDKWAHIQVNARPKHSPRLLNIVIPFEEIGDACSAGRLASGD